MIVAAHEDEPIVWVQASDEGRAVVEAEAEFAVRGGQYHASLRATRPFDPAEDCFGTNIEHFMEDCGCGTYIAEGWIMECPPDHPQASPAWRVEWVE